jgi:hypothetical protein
LTRSDTSRAGAGFGNPGADVGCPARRDLGAIDVGQHLAMAVIAFLVITEKNAQAVAIRDAGRDD